MELIPPSERLTIFRGMSFGFLFTLVYFYFENVQFSFFDFCLFMCLMSFTICGIRFFNFLLTHDPLF